MCDRLPPPNIQHDCELPIELVQMEQLIHDHSHELPEDSLQKFLEALDKLKEDTIKRRRILLSIQEKMANLRLDIKYLIFDLEATRRERDDAHRKLQQ